MDAAKHEKVNPAMNHQENSPGGAQGLIQSYVSELVKASHLLEEQIISTLPNEEDILLAYRWECGGPYSNL